MISRRRLLLAAPVAALAAWLPEEAHATLARALTLGELVKDSRFSLVGTPLEAHSRWESGAGRRRIVTYTRVRVDETYGGSPDTEVLVRTLGGRVGKVGQIVHGEAVLTLQQPTVLFLHETQAGPLRVTAMSQGEYPIVERRQVRRLSLSKRLPELVGKKGATARLENLPVPDARDLITKEWRRVH